MKISAVLLCLPIIGLLAYGAHADQLQPLQSATFNFRDHIASVFYVRHGNEFRVVTTLAPIRGRTGVPMRFTATLQQGQAQTLSIGGWGTEIEAATLHIRRNGDAVTVDLIEPTSSLNQ